MRLQALEYEEVYDVAMEDGNQDLDYAATITLLEKWAGVEVKKATARPLKNPVSSTVQAVANRRRRRCDGHHLALAERF